MTLSLYIFFFLADSWLMLNNVWDALSSEQEPSGSVTQGHCFLCDWDKWS